MILIHNNMNMLIMITKRKENEEVFVTLTVERRVPTKQTRQRG